MEGKTCTPSPMFSIYVSTSTVAVMTRVNIMHRIRLLDGTAIGSPTFYLQNKTSLYFKVLSAGFLGNFLLFLLLPPPLTLHSCFAL